MVHASVLPEPRALRTVTLSCATRNEQLSTTMREWGEAVLYHSFVRVLLVI